MPLPLNHTHSTTAPGSLQPSPSHASASSTASTLSIQSIPPSSSSPRSAFRPPRFSAGFSLFSVLFDLALETLNLLMERTDFLPFAAAATPFLKLTECLYHLIRLKRTMLLDPKRINPRQMLRLSRAAAFIARVTGRASDFTPWTSLTESQLDAISPLPPKPCARHRADDPLRLHTFTTGRSATLLPNPGATLARVYETLAKLLNTLPTSPSTPSPLSSHSAIDNPQSAIESSSPSTLSSQSAIHNPQSAIESSSPSLPSSSPHSALRTPHSHSAPP